MKLDPFAAGVVVGALVVFLPGVCFLACAGRQGEAELSALGVEAKVRGPWVPDPAPTVVALGPVYVGRCDDAADAGAER